MEKVFLMCQGKANKKHAKKLGALVKIMITQLVIYWSMNTFQNMTK